MKANPKMIKELYLLVDTETLDPMEERFIAGVAESTDLGEIAGTLPDRDVMTINRLHSKYCKG